VSRWSPGSFGRHWHYPITAVVYRDAGLPPWFWLKTDSVSPPIFLHASHNLWMQSIFTPLTIDTEYTKWIAGDLGLAFVGVAAVVAVVFWLNEASCQLEPVDNFCVTAHGSVSMRHGGTNRSRSDTTANCRRPRHDGGRGHR
jgi:hypothetical protein